MLSRSVLIANRGEIAVRVIRTCRRLGIRTIGVYSDADARALHVAEADEAFRIGPPAAVDSYLNATVLLDVARRANADAVHPGYGFLSENPEFAQSCIDAGLIWIGPTPTAMRAVGDKAQARALAEQHGVPVLAGYHGLDQRVETLLAEAERIGFPVLIKASAGGGGRGMRVVEAAPGFAEALESARREAISSFGNDRVLIERYLSRPRHVEVQVLGDQHGNLVHLGERECSIQRRHQKLIEEAPSPAVDDQLRKQMGEAAVRLMRAASYTNAGTVEFLVEPDGTFAFLEVNARLQVEHPVTEAVTGLDLVELQLRVAGGEPLPIQQADVRIAGHAIEVRVIAEDPLADFLPSSGRIGGFAAPEGIRVDTWLMPGAVVSPYYDSLLAKLIAHASDRASAVNVMREALQKIEIDGVRNNVDLLLRVLEEPAFNAGDLHTSFLDEHGVIDGMRELPAEVLAAASVADMHTPTRGDPWRGRSGWRIGGLERSFTWRWQGRAFKARVSAEMKTPSNVWDHADVRVVELEGRSYRLQRPLPLSVDDTAASQTGAGGAGRLTAPMPGRIVKLAVQEQQEVGPNQPLIVLEAMKMEHVVEAPHAGVVTQICVQVGDQVRAGALLLELGDALS